MANVRLCGGFLVDDATLKIVTVKGKKIMALEVKDDYPNVFKAKCGGFWLDGDAFKLMNGVLTKKRKLTAPKNVNNNLCGGYKMDADVFAIAGNVLSYKG